jgi:F-type H+-transporting ATPase subunit b
VHHEPVGVGEILTSPSFIATLINFLIFAFLFVRLAGGPVGSFFSGRSESVARELEEARRLTAEANEKQAEYEERLRKIDDELADLRTQMIRSGEKERDRLVAEARDKAERMRRDAELAIEQRIRALRADLTRETVEAALQQATKLLEAKMTTEDQDRLAASYVDALGAQANKALGADGSARSSS